MVAKPAQPGRVRSYRRGERVVAAPGQRDGLFGGELLDAGGGQGQHGEVDTAGVHRRDPARSEVQQWPDHLLVWLQPAALAGHVFRRDVVLFERDGPHVEPP
ncbi:hypothetical protein [Fodinicola feengrottensis]|uniref:hypothetical protein n=1 Tax=Fodinicola feengrottensis TaxID=435914 RepID=UPI002442C98D|nr:hypothetical protein [Fodinicola feengrottensis]